MAGPFYPPPPVFIGGAQPFAPHLGIVQSGPTPQPPPIRGPLVAATFALLIGSWTPGPQPAQGSPRFVYPTAAVVSQPPPYRNPSVALITDQWVDRTVTVISLAQVAAVSASAPIGPGVANSAPYLSIRASWDASFTDAYYQGAGDIAPRIQAPVIQTQQAVSTAAFWTVRSSWDIVPPAIQLFEGLDGLAPLIPAPIVSTQTAVNQVPYQVIRQAWEPVFRLPQTAAAIATQPIVSAPPVVTGAQLANLIATNQPPWYAIPKAGTVASWLPAPSAPTQPQSVSYSTLYSLIRVWDPPVWWPLPGLTLQPQSGPAATSGPPAPQSALLRLLLQSWEATVQPQQDLGFTYQQAVAPLPVSQVNLRLLLQSWDIGIQPAQDVPFVYPTIVIPSTPPASNASLMRLLVSAWDISPFIAQRAPVVTVSGPVPQPPPVRSYATFNLTVASWPAQWWPAQHAPPFVQLPPLVPISLRRDEFIAGRDHIRYTVGRDNVEFSVPREQVKFKPT